MPRNGIILLFTVFITFNAVLTLLPERPFPVQKPMAELPAPPNVFQTKYKGWILETSLPGPPVGKSLEFNEIKVKKFLGLFPAYWKNTNVKGKINFYWGINPAVDFFLIRADKSQKEIIKRCDFEYTKDVGFKLILGKGLVESFSNGALARVMETKGGSEYHFLPDKKINKFVALVQLVGTLSYKNPTQGNKPFVQWWWLKEYEPAFVVFAETEPGSAVPSPPPKAGLLPLGKGKGGKKRDQEKKRLP